MNKHVNLSNIFDEERNEMDKNKIEFHQLYSQLSAQSRKESKPERCFYCGRKTTQFCNSHTIPAFVLRRIAENGKLFTTGKIIGSPLISDERGVNNSSIFNIICRECDSKVFKDYETPSNYDVVPTNRMLAQMAMKNHLRNIAKRLFERAFYAELKNKFGKKLGDMQEIIELDFKEDMRGFRQAKKAIEKDWGDEYYLFFYEKLDYVVPIAFQGELNLLVGLNGEQINNVYNKSSNYKIQPLHVSVFPLEKTSVVMLFIEKGAKRYRSFYKEFNKLTLADKLAAINYMIFCLSEDVYLNKCLNDAYFEGEEFRRVVGKTNLLLSDNVSGNDANVINEDFSFSSMRKINNFLTLKVASKQAQEEK